MKKLFIAASLLIGMIAGAMVLSSFSEPKENDNNACMEITMADGWTRVGQYQGVSKDNKTHEFVIWEKEGMCNSYYWVDRHNQGYKNPDEVTSDTGKGVLRKNSEGKWYAAYIGVQYFIDF